MINKTTIAIVMNKVGGYEIPRKSASQSIEAGQMDKTSKIIQKIIQIKELAGLSLPFLIESRMYKITDIAIVMRKIFIAVILLSFCRYI